MDKIKIITEELDPRGSADGLAVLRRQGCLAEPAAPAKQQDNNDLPTSTTPSTSEPPLTKKELIEEAKSIRARCDEIISDNQPGDESADLAGGIKVAERFNKK